MRAHLGLEAIKHALTTVSVICGSSAACKKCATQAERVRATLRSITPVGPAPGSVARGVSYRS